MTPVDEIFDPEAIPESPFFESRKVCITLPFYKSVEPRTMFAIMSLLDRKKTACMLDHGDAYIQHSRNKLADNFLKSGLEWQLTFDDDCIPPFGNAKIFNQFTGFNFPEKFAGLNTIDRLLSSGKTLIGGLYFGRWHHGKPVYAEGSESKQEEAFCRRGPQDLVKPTRWFGTGCALIHRSVYLDIEKHFPHLARKPDGTGGNWFTSSEHDLRNAVTKAIASLEAGEDATSALEVLKRGQLLSRKFSGLGTGEDVTLCHRAAQSGHQPWIDLGLVCGHTGVHCFGPKKIMS